VPADAGSADNQVQSESWQLTFLHSHMQQTFLVCKEPVGQLQADPGILCGQMHVQFIEQCRPCRDDHLCLSNML